MNYSSKYIASGTYGCVIKPAYNCDTKLTLENTVSKLFSDKEEWKNEIEQNNKISEIDKLNQFTVKMFSSCEINKTYIFKNVKNIDRCSNLYDDDRVFQIIYENGGFDLRDLFSYNELFIKFPNFNIRDFLIKLGIIFEALCKIELLGLSHRDIKLDNLLYNGNKISLIDFGLMIEKRKLFDTGELEMYIKTNIYYYPDELKLYSIRELKSSFNNIKLNSSNLILMIENFIFNNKKLSSNQLYLSEIRKIIDKIKKDALEFLEFMKYSKEKIDLKRFEKVDVYLLGVVLLELLSYIAIYIPKFEIKSEFFELVSKMIEINPYKRIDMRSASDLYRQIIDY
jgi:serine/threonine protein kinase